MASWLPLSTCTKHEICYVKIICNISLLHNPLSTFYITLLHNPVLYYVKKPFKFLSFSAETINQITDLDDSDNPDINAIEKNMERKKSTTTKRKITVVDVHQITSEVTTTTTTNSTSYEVSFKNYKLRFHSPVLRYLFKS